MIDMYKNVLETSVWWLLMVEEEMRGNHAGVFKTTGSILFLQLGGKYMCSHYYSLNSIYMIYFTIIQRKQKEKPQTIQKELYTLFGNKKAGEELQNHAYFYWSTLCSMSDCQMLTRFLGLPPGTPYLVSAVCTSPSLQSQISSPCAKSAVAFCLDSTVIFVFKIRNGSGKENTHSHKCISIHIYTMEYRNQRCICQQR